MEQFLPSYYFDLSAFDHPALFETDKFVWNAIIKISAYLKSIELGKISVDIPQGVYVIDKHLVTIEEGVIIEPGSYIKGPCYIGKGSTVRHGAYIRGNVIAGQKCVIGHDSELKNCILLNEAHAAHFAYLGDSILGNHVNLGAGTKCANLKLLDNEVSIKTQGTRINTGMRKFGAIIGDRSQLGCNVVTNPGTLIGKDVFCSPTLSVEGVIPSNSYIKSSEKIIIEKRSTIKKSF